jgi:hypothetical protein
MLQQDKFGQAMLVDLGWRFGQSYGGGHLAGQLIMHTLMNRVRLGWGSVLQVIDTVPHSMAENEIPPQKYPSIWEPTFVKLLHTVEGIYDGSTPDLSKGALYWCDLNRIERPWFKEKIIDAVNPLTNEKVHPHVADINSLWFFR